VLISFVLLACGGSDDHDPVSSEPTMNIVETAVEDGRFTTLVAALQAAELDDDLSGPGPFIVFAPTDDVFFCTRELWIFF
jgi:fasciclin domain-containing protein